MQMTCEHKHLPSLLQTEYEKGFSEDSRCAKQISEIRQSISCDHDRRGGRTHRNVYRGTERIDQRESTDPWGNLMCCPLASSPEGVLLEGDEHEGRRRWEMRLFILRLHGLAGRVRI